MSEQAAADPCVLGGDHIDALQHVERAQGNVGEVSNRRRDYI
jgi:hypothetical protein